MIQLTLASALLALLTCGEPKETSVRPPVDSCEESVNQLKINQLQLLGSHNSYRNNLPHDIAALLANPPMPLPNGFNPKEWDYGHEPLEIQFEEYGIRSIELDVFHDPQGGLFYNRIGNGFVGRSSESGEAKLKEPGLKVLHYPDFDYRSNYLTFQDALGAVKNWSDTHPDHLPITIIVEPKEDDPSQLLPGMGLTSTIQFDKEALNGIDLEIKKVFGEKLEKVITPGMVKGNHSTLNEAILKGDFPTVSESRGKVIFVMLPSKNELADYLEGHPSLEGRAMFAFAKPGRPEAAFLNFNDPVENESEISKRVGEGYFVRTRSDADTYEARSGNFDRMEAAFRSGAQIISTDYYKRDEREGWSEFEVHFPDHKLALVNPVNGGDMACEVSE